MATRKRATVQTIAKRKAAAQEAESAPATDVELAGLRLAHDKALNRVQETKADLEAAVRTSHSQRTR